ncbi:MAG: hypothetical protein V3T23_01720 [Nitrososphaerales archaeon]
MTSSHTGYQGPDFIDKDDDEPKTKPPEECIWKIEIKPVARSDEYPETIFAQVEIDGDVVGMVRLPNTEYLRWLRERIQ